MPHCLLDGDQVGAGFIEMKSESVTKAMEIEAAFGFQFTEPVQFVTVQDVCDYLATKA